MAMTDQAQHGAGHQSVAGRRFTGALTSWERHPADLARFLVASLVCMAGVALTQLVRPGAPVVYGNFTVDAHMRSGSPSFAISDSAASQRARSVTPASELVVAPAG